MNSRRESLAFLLMVVLGTSFVRSNRKSTDLQHFNIEDYIKIFSTFELGKSGLLADEINAVRKFQIDVIEHLFADFEELRSWLVVRVNLDYSSLRFVVHKSCIVSHTEFALLVCKFQNQFS